MSHIWGMQGPLVLLRAQGAGLRDGQGRPEKARGIQWDLLGKSGVQNGAGWTA